MNKKIVIAGLLALFAIAGAGCASKQTTAPATPSQETQTSNAQNSTPEQTTPDPSAQSAENNGASQTPASPSTEPTKTKTDTENSGDRQTQQITVYYTDTQENGLKEQKKEITYPSELEKLQKAFEALQKSGDSALIPLWSEKISVHKIKLDNGALTFDISLPDEARLGAGGEELAIDALKKTMFQFKEVKTLDLLVDGQSLESLMGHVDLDHPMSR
ncbi:GerMN domain-containing protein [Paenibacillus sp. SEL3]|uniref:GerMN domain-containing protein n=1 Tax=Paenibacillus polymyxa TaxID=1406 RepID=A0A8I1IMA9_PAEPO|nr:MULTISPECIES: GerMN domain-containing protein [Paenibacillus]KAF6575056.1 GerMN domain-containing protein [Paenibacillus sp. EKM206P]KAF6590270.1 GerMN domain-containing protein [Paenibacillus sp. EKM205P]KEO79455.1 dihydrolipoamide succinyltransferase [Paenibacillus polymyxa]MBM0632372.1 GerMN domain-containing protein [Paenibacillus polymyxa]MBO3286832.1 GerMN domain-containing protein [Paenibacillus polymyxa]